MGGLGGRSARLLLDPAGPVDGLGSTVVAGLEGAGRAAASPEPVMCLEGEETGGLLSASFGALGDLRSSSKNSSRISSSTSAMAQAV